MTIKNNNVGDKNRKFSGKKIMLVTALLSGGVVIRVNNHINNSFGHAPKEVINFDLTLESTDVLIDDSGVFYVGQGTAIDNFNIYDFVTILDESGNVIADKDVTLEWDIKEYFEGATFGTKGEYLITITATTDDGRTGELEYKLVVREGHVFEEIKEIDEIEVDITNKTNMLDFQEHFRVLNSTTGEDTGAPILSTLEDEDLQSVGTTQVIFYTELDGVKFTNSVHISVVDTIAPIINLENAFNNDGIMWDKSGKSITISDLDKTLGDFTLDEYATAYDASGDYELSWDFNEVMEGELDNIVSKTVTITAIDGSGNESFVEIYVDISTVSIEFKNGISEVAFELFHTPDINDPMNQVSAFYNVLDAAGNPVADDRISWDLTKEILSTIGEYRLTIEVLDENKNELIGAKGVEVKVDDTIAPEANLVQGVSTTFDVEVDQFNSIENLYMYLNGISNIEDLVTITDNSGLWGYRFEYNGQPLTDELLKTVGIKGITLVVFDYDNEGNELNKKYLTDANGQPIDIILNVTDTQKATVVITDEIINLEVMQNATKEMIEITNYAEINDNSGTFSWDLRVKGSQDAVMDYEDMLGKITTPAGVALELVVTDASGNKTYRDMLLIVTDFESPIFEIRKTEETININPSASDITSIRNRDNYVRATDNSGKVDVDWNFDQVVNMSVAGIYEVTVTAKDAAGNLTEATITFTVVDNEAPSIIVNTKTIEIEANEYTTVGEFEFDINLKDYITVTDNSNGLINTTFDYSNVDFGEIGTYEVIITASDAVGNEAINIIEIKVIAGEPKVNVLKDQVIVDTMKIENNVFTGIKIEIKDGKILIERASATDESEVLSHLTMENLVEFLTISGETIESAIWDLTSLDVKSIGTNDIQLTVTNNFGKTVTETIEFVVIYEYDSLIKVSGDNYIDIEIDTNKTMTPDWFKSEYEVTDYVEYRAGGGQATIIWRTAELNLVDFSTVGTYIITASITDGHTDTDQVSLTLNIIDTTGPELTVTQPNAFEINAQTASNIDINNYASATDNSGQPVSLSWNLSTQVDFTKVGTYVVTIKAIDASGNETTKEITFEVEDTQPPVLAINPGMDIQTIEINSRDASNFNVNSFVTATDNSGVAPELEWNIQDVDFSTVNSYTVEISATDKEGNKSNVVTITFVIEDTIAPSIDIDPSGLEELKVEISTKTENDYSDWLEDYVTVTDNSGESITPTWDITGVDFNTFGTYMVIITAADSSNNTTTQVVSFGVSDTTAPVITIKDDKEITTLEVFDGKLADFTLADFATCSDASTCTIEWDIQNVDFSTVGTYVVTIKAMDIYGNESRAEITIEVQDNTKPEIVITRPDILLSMGKFTSSDFSVYDFATVTDNYDKSVSLIWNIDTVDFDSEGDYTVIVSAVDSSGNEATEKIVTFTVQDNGMILTEKIPFVIEVDPNNKETNFDVNTYFEATREDGSAVDNITWNLTDDMVMTYGTHGVVLTITFDNDTKTVDIEVTLEVTDNTKPVITEVTDTATIELGNLTEYDNLTPGDFVTVSDNSSNYTVSWNLDNVVNNTVAATYVVTITATDDAGNFAEHDVNILVEDTTNPVLELNDDFDRNNMIWSKSNKELSILAGDKTQAEIDLWELVTATDASTSGLTISWNLTDLDNPLTHTVTITVEDASGNIATETITVILLKPTPILNNFSVDKSYNEVSVDVDLSNLKQSVSDLTISLYDASGNLVGTAYNENQAIHNHFTINHTFSNLLSNTEYNVVLEYTYATGANGNVDTTITEEQSVNTLSYSQNDVLGTITDVYTSHTSLNVNYELSNDLGLISSAELVLIDSSNVETKHTMDVNNESGNHQFMTLDPNSEYRVEIRLEYNFNDGNNIQTKVSDKKDVRTLAYSEHDVITDITGITQSPSTISADYNITDAYGLIIADGMKAKIYDALTMNQVGSDIILQTLNGSVTFTGLNANTQYIVIIEAVLDLRDGTTVTKETGSQTTTESHSFDEITVNVNNIIVDYNDITFDYEVFDPNGLLVGSDDANKVGVSINGTVVYLPNLSGTASLANLLNDVTSGTLYDVQIHFEYNLKDGNPNKIHDTNLYGFVETTRAYDVDRDLTLTSHNLASDTQTIYVDYSLRNLNFIGDMSTMSIIITNGTSTEEILLSAIFGDVTSIPLEGQITLSDINGTPLEVNTAYEVSIGIDYDLRDGYTGVQREVLLLESTEIKTQDQELSGYNVISTVTRGYTFLNTSFEIENTTAHADLLDTFQIALLDTDGNVLPNFDYVSHNAVVGTNTFKFENLTSDAEYTIVYRVENPNYTDGTNGHNEYIDITRDISTRTYDTNLINVDYTLTQGLTYLHLTDIQILNTNEAFENIDYSSVIMVITYTTREGQLVTIERDLGSLTEGDITSALFTGIQSNRDVNIEFKLDYDLKDGSGVQSGDDEIVRTSDTKTLEYDFTFVIENDEVLVTGLTPGFTGDHLVIFEEVEGYTVKDIKADAFYSDGISFDKLTIPRTLETIGQNAFRGVSLTEVNLTNVLEVIPTVSPRSSTYSTQGILVIADNAFRDNAIVGFDFTTTETIGVSSFRDNKLANVIIGDTVSYIGDEAFVNGGVLNVTLGASLSDENFGTNTFVGNQITDLTVGHIGFRHDSLGLSQNVFNNSGFNLTFADTAVGKIEEQAWRYDTNNDTRSNVQIINLNIGAGITEIGISAFLSNNLNDVVIGDGVELIDSGAFFQTGINTLTLGKSLIKIGNQVFEGNNIEKLVLSDNLETIGYRSFSRNQIEELVLPNTVSDIGYRAFEDNGMKKLTLGSLLSDENFEYDSFIGNEINDLTVGNIGFKHNSLGSSEKVFDNAGFKLTFADTAKGKIEDQAWRYDLSTDTRSNVQITGLYIGSGIEEIGTSAFLSNVLDDVVIGDNVTKIDNSAFFQTGINTLTLGASLVTIGNQTFEGNNISKLVFSENLETIGERAFDNNNIKELVLPNTVTDIGERAFEDNGMTKLVLGSLLSDNNFEDDAFIGNSISDLTVGNIGFRHDSLGSSEKVFDNTGFKLTFADTAEGKIEDQAWRYDLSTDTRSNVQIIDLTIGSGIKEIGVSAFLNNSLSDVIIGDGVEVVGNGSFFQTGMKTVTLGSAVKTIEAQAFEGNNLVDVVFPESLEVIEYRAFARNSIKDVILTDYISSMGREAFMDNEITTIQLNTMISTFEEGVFENNKFTTLPMTNNITSIGAKAFKGNSLTNVVIPSNINSIGNEAFAQNVDENGNKTITELEVKDGVTSSKFGTETFEGSAISVLTVSTTGFKHDTFGYSGNVFDNTGFKLVFSDSATGTIGDSAWEYRAGDSTSSSVQINSVTIGNNIGTIGDKAFLGNALKTVVIGDSVTNIGEQSFASMQIDSLTLGNSIETLGKEAFMDNSIVTFTFPETLSRIEAGAFKNNFIETLVLPDSVEYVGDYAFENNGMINLTIGKELSDTNFGSDTFITNQIKDLTVGNIGFRHDSLGSSETVFDNLGFKLTFADTAVGKIEDQAWRYDTANDTRSNVQIIGLNIGLGIKEIGVSAFLSNALNDVVIGDGVTIIGNSSFFQTSIKTLTLGSSVQSIGNQAFENNNIESLVLPSSLKVIGERAFDSNSIKSLVLPDSVTEVKERAFEDNEIIDLSIGVGLNASNIGSDAFSENVIKYLTLNNADLKHNTLGSSEKVFDVTGFEVVYTDKAIGTIPTSAWDYSSDSTTSNVQMKKVTFGDKITTIGNNAFQGNDFGNIEIGKSVEIIGNYAFSSTNISSVILSDSVELVGVGSFSDNLLTTVDFTQNIETIGSEAFKGNSLTSVSLGNSLITIGNNAFNGNAIATLDLGTSVETIDYNAFEGNLITTLVIPNSVTTLGVAAFKSNLIADVTFSSGVTSISNSLFEGNNITSFVFESQINSIGSNAFSGNSISEVTIPSNIISVGNSAFTSNGTKKLVIGDGVPETVFSAGNAFMGNSISELTIGHLGFSYDTLGGSSTVFDSNGYKLTISNGADGIIGKNAWRAGAGYSSVQITELVIGDAVTSIDSGAFIDNNLGNIKMGAEVKSISSSFFRAGVTNVEFNSKITAIGAQAFSLNSIKNVTIPDSVVTMGEKAFESNGIEVLVLGSGLAVGRLGVNTFISNNIKDLTLGQTGFVFNTFGDSDSVFDDTNGFDLTFADSAIGVTEQNDWRYAEGDARYSQVPINNLTIGDGLTVVGISSFLGNPLNELIIGNKVTAISNAAFFGCSINKLTLGNSLKTIGDQTFQSSNTDSLKEVTFPATFTGMGSRSFVGNTALSKVTYLGGNIIKSSDSFDSNPTFYNAAGEIIT